MARTEDRRPGDPYHGDGVYLHVRFGNGRHVAYVACARRAPGCRHEAGNCWCRTDRDAFEELRDKWFVPIEELVPVESVQPSKPAQAESEWLRARRARRARRAA